MLDLPPNAHYAEVVVATNVKKTIDEAIGYIIELEGGYANDPHDDGGETKYGITIAVARAEGYNGDMKKLPFSRAEDIYYKKYWKPLKLEEITKIADVRFVHLLLQMGVHLGVSRATKILQRAINYENYAINKGKAPKRLALDGKMGIETLGALSVFLFEKKTERLKFLEKTLKDLQKYYYYRRIENSPKKLKYRIGWLNRIEEIKR